MLTGREVNLAEQGFPAVCAQPAWDRLERSDGLDEVKSTELNYISFSIVWRARGWKSYIVGKVLKKASEIRLHRERNVFIKDESGGSLSAHRADRIHFSHSWWCEAPAPP